jgi:tetratricopeptide (TPR) repeat protein
VNRPSVLSVIRLAGIAAALGLPTALAAQSQNQQTASAVPTQAELARNTMAGNYLAGRQANVLRDAASAAAYYRAALRLDPKNPELLGLAFQSVLAEGNIDEAVKLGERLLAIDKGARNIRLVIGIKAIKQKQYGPARSQLTQAARGPITDLTATLLAGWAMTGANEAKSGVALIDKLPGPDWYATLKTLHTALILDLSGNHKDAGKRFEMAYKLDGTALPVVRAYAGWLSRNGKGEEAMKLFQALDKQLPNHPLVTDAMAMLKKGEKLPMLVDSVQSGAAEVLYNLGSAIGRREEELSLANRGLAYLQLALYLQPNHYLALHSLADLYEAMKQPQLAVNTYERIPANSPLKRSADIQSAIDLDGLDRTDEAKKLLQKLIAAEPNNRDAMLALGSILRERKQYAECADAYDKAIKTVANPERQHWTMFYFRGICYERSKQWPKAEADLKKALELYPNQPQVLNYLGYSWVDQGTNLDEGVAMIKRSVEQRPDDGYIVDSLGWAYYRLGNYDVAVKQLERAVELKPTDPTINDHLGDAYWRVGRTLEARFQWSHARDLKPEPDDLAKIEHKLKTGTLEDAATPAPTAGNEPPPKKANGG